MINGVIVILLGVMGRVFGCFGGPKTMYAEIGSTVTFVAEYPYYHRHDFEFRNESTMLVSGHSYNRYNRYNRYKYFRYDYNITYNEHIPKEKFNVSMPSFDKYYRREKFTILLYNAETMDNGNYTLMQRPGRTCRYTLYILSHPPTPQIKANQDTGATDVIEESRPISYTNDFPVGMTVNKSWLVDGNDVTSQSSYLVSEDSLTFLKTDRRMNGTSITYRWTYTEYQLSSETNYTLNIAYGPDPYLTFVPYMPIYYLEVGDNLPEVTCSAQCYPECNYVWKSPAMETPIYGQSLRLGLMSQTTQGEYTCVATRNGTYKTATRSFVVVLKSIEDATSVIAMACLLGVTIVAVVILTVYVCALRCKIAGTNAGQSESSKTENQTDVRNERCPTDQRVSIDGAMDTYTDLQTESREYPIDAVYDPISTDGNIELHYENAEAPKSRYV